MRVVSVWSTSFPAMLLLDHLDSLGWRIGRSRWLPLRLKAAARSARSSDPRALLAFPERFQNGPNRPTAHNNQLAQAQAKTGLAPMGGAGLEPATSCL